MPTYHEIITAQLARLPEIAAWPDINALFEATPAVAHPDWEIPVLACQAVGGQAEVAHPAAAAVACLQISIMLVDDMLDEDPRGIYRERGVGPTANLALAFQGAAGRLLAMADVPAAQRLAALNSLSRAGLATAYGQSLDVQNLRGEENYWRVVEAKSTPFYGAIYEIGAYLGGATAVTANALFDFGVLIGEMIQIEDDLADAFAVPANADWLQGRNNLLLLYAESVEHPQQQQFCQLKALAAQPDMLASAQAILVRCGAASYAVYELVKRFQAAQSLLAELALPHPEILDNSLLAYRDVLYNRLQDEAALAPKFIFESLQQIG